MRLANGIVLEKDPTFGELKFSALRREVRIQNEDGTVSDEINEFLTTFFKLYPTSTMSELSYYVNEGILKTIGKDYIFQSDLQSKG